MNCKLTYKDFFEEASECFLNKYLPYESTEWTDLAIESHIEENIIEAYEDWSWERVYEYIDDTAYTFWIMYKRHTDAN